MTPYYSDDLVTIYHGDCREWMPEANVIVTDPPYGTGFYATDRAVGDWLAPLITSVQNIAVFGWPEDLVRLSMTAGRVPDEWIVWWPSNAELKGRAVAGVPRETEHIAIFGDVRPVHGMPRKARVSDGYRPNARSRGRRHVAAAGKRWGDVWRDPAPGLAFQSHLRLHPNEKPVSLMARLLQTVTPDGTVLDPFMGSGSTLVAAKSLGRRAIGIEINERYCAEAARRCAQEVLGLVG